MLEFRKSHSVARGEQISWHLSEEADESVSPRAVLQHHSTERVEDPPRPFDWRNLQRVLPAESVFFSHGSKAVACCFSTPRSRRFRCAALFLVKGESSLRCSSFARLPLWAKCCGPDEQNVRIPPNARQLRLRRNNENVFVIISCH